jgi:hypothetical protein
MNLALALVVAGLAFSAASIFVTSLEGLTAKGWPNDRMISACRGLLSQLGNRFLDLDGVQLIALFSAVFSAPPRAGTRLI